MNYAATIDDIGKWDGQEAEAVNCWNRYIAPALEQLSDDVDAIESAELAWEDFCGKRAGETYQQLARKIASNIKHSIAIAQEGE